MGDRIEIETRSLAQDRDTIQSQTEGLKTKMNQMQEQMERLSGMWEGPAKEAFMTQFQTDYAYMMDFLAEMNKYVQAMTYAENEYNKCENDVAQIVAAIQI